MSNYNESGVNRFYLLLCIDTLLAILAGVTGHFLRFGHQGIAELQTGQVLTKISVVAAVFIGSSYVFDVYNLGRHRDKRLIANNILLAALFSFFLLSILYFLIPSLELGRGVLAMTLVLFIGYQFFWHIAFAAHFSRLLPMDKVLILGIGELAEKIGCLVQSPSFQFSHSFVGYVAARNGREQQTVPEQLILCDLPELSKRVNALAVTHIVVAVEERRGNSPMHQQLLNCKLRGVTIQDSPTFFEMQTGKLLLEHMDMDWLIFSNGFKRSSIVSAVKRLVDIGLALLGLTLTLPFIPLVALLVKLNAPGPVFYTQLRVGQRGKPFLLYKFRTMPQAAEQESGAVWAQQHDPRIRLIGGLLRKYRIDELPQLYNVLKGQMSFVGPRPERPEFVQDLVQVIPLYAKRHFIKPGLTGWAQISFPYGSSVEDSYEKLRYDLYYFKNMTLVFDTIILVKTLKVVLSGAGGR